MAKLTRVTDWLVKVKSKANMAIERLLDDKLSDNLNAKDFGAKCDGVSDDTDSLNKAADAARELGVPLVVSGRCLVTGEVNFRSVQLEASNATFVIAHAGTGIILGGVASNANNPRQMFGCTERTIGAPSPTTPDVMIKGAKCQHITVERSEYVELYANADASVYYDDYSIAYCTFTFKYINSILIRGENRGWINENQFFLNRTHFITIADGDYSHNHNKFHNGTMEEKGAIDIQRGNNNHFFGFRFERNPAEPDRTLNIHFGSYTWNNSIQATWLSSPSYTNEPYNPRNLVTVVDEGQGNAVRHIQDELSDEVALLSLTEDSGYISSVNTGSPQTPVVITSLPDVYNIRHLTSHNFAIVRSFYQIWESGAIPVRNGDMFTMSSDASLFRMRVYLLDANKAVITDDLSDAISYPGASWDSSLHMYGTNANVALTKARIIDTSRIKYVKIVLMAGGGVTGSIFNHVRVTGRYYKYSSAAPRLGVVSDNKPSSTVLPVKDDTEVPYVGSGITLFNPTDISEKIVLSRERYSVLSVGGSVVTVRTGGSITHINDTDMSLVYTEGGINKTVGVSAIAGSNITLTDAVPAGVTPGSFIDILHVKSM